MLAGTKDLPRYGSNLDLAHSTRQPASWEHLGASILPFHSGTSAVGPSKRTRRSTDHVAEPVSIHCVTPATRCGFAPHFESVTRNACYAMKSPFGGAAADSSKSRSTKSEIASLL